MKALVKQFMKFAAVGIIAFIIDYGVMVILTELVHINYLISATISFTLSVIFSYFASMRYVFRRKEGLSRWREFLIFAVLSFIGLAINDVLMYLLTSIAGITYLISKLIAAVIVTWWNFATRKRFLDAGPDIAEEIIDDTVDDAIGDTTDGIIGNAVDGTTGGIFGGAINGTVDDMLDGAIGDAVDGITDDEPGDAVDEVIDDAFGDTLDEQR